MSKNPDSEFTPLCVPDRCANPPQAAPDLARHMRGQIGAFLQRLASGTQALHLPSPTGDGLARGDGHFHLAPELFLQLGGWTRFRFPHDELLLAPGEALLLPPKLRHAEQVGAGPDGTPFSNIVIYAADAALTCHLAHEAAPGEPHILHLEARQTPAGQHLHDWLLDAARFGQAGGPDATLAAAQSRALLTAACAGVLRALDDAQAAARPEPPLVAQVRVLIENQLGDHTLSVRRLAGQCGCTADYLSHLFHQTSGEHLVAYLNRLRMARATRLLRESALAGKEVAWACGFASQSYFIRTFREHFGITPKAWRSGREQVGESRPG